MRHCLESVPAQALQKDSPDAHWICVDGSKVLASCSLWWRNVPFLPCERLGLIGHYEAANEAGGRAVLARTCEELRARGCTLAVGPMDGSTWRRYRLITRRGRTPAFFLEPDNPDEWPRHFRAVGFKTLAAYTSALNPRLDERDVRLMEAEARLIRRGVRIRAIDLARFDNELKKAFAVAVASFRNNFLYTDIGESDFLELYRPVKDAIRPELSLFASRGDTPVGFIFALPDLAQRRRGEPVTNVVIKTVACLPGRDHAGLGTVLMGRVRHAAHELGFKGAVHALMHADNSSQNWGKRGTRTIRRYELFSRRLDA